VGVPSRLSSCKIDFTHRINGGGKSFITLFLFVNAKWAVEDNLIQSVCDLTEQQRKYIQDDQANGQLYVVHLADIDLPMPPALFADTVPWPRQRWSFCETFWVHFATAVNYPCQSRGVARMNTCSSCIRSWKRPPKVASASVRR